MAKKASNPKPKAAKPKAPRRQAALVEIAEAKERVAKRRAPARKPGEPRRGPLPWKPTKDEREQIEVMAAMGYTQEQIALVLDKSVDSLARHCRKELDRGVAKCNAVIAGNLFKKAKEGDTASMMFWLKTRAHWRETHRHEHVGDGGGPVETVNMNRDMTAKEAAERYKEKLG